MKGLFTRLPGKGDGPKKVLFKPLYPKRYAFGRGETTSLTLDRTRLERVLIRERSGILRSGGIYFMLPMKLLLISGVVLLLNLPFGYWRAHVRKFSLPWYLAVHLPVPLVISLRLASGIGWHKISFPFLIGAYFGGQLLGGRIHRGRSKRRSEG
jgi:hypothetical protein